MNDFWTEFMYQRTYKAALRAHSDIETVAKPTAERLMENVHMQGFRNPEE
jgi:hypothetical protein